MNWLCRAQDSDHAPTGDRFNYRLIDSFLSAVHGHEYSPSPFSSDIYPIFAGGKEFSFDDNFRGDFYESYPAGQLSNLEIKKPLPIPKFKKLFKTNNLVLFSGLCDTTISTYFTSTELDFPIEEGSLYVRIKDKIEEKLKSKITPYQLQYDYNLKCPWYYAFSPELIHYRDWFNKISKFTDKQLDWSEINNAIIENSLYIE